jgi:hypothetical protein
MWMDMFCDPINLFSLLPGFFHVTPLHFTGHVNSMPEINNIMKANTNKALI